jgi:hypothetical protein
MAVIHLIQQGKGGVGKSMIASFLYQALLHFGKDVTAFDTDPVNATLAGFNEFSVRRKEIIKDGNIDPRAFDDLLDSINDLPPDSHAIVDNGASSFVALSAYLQENEIIPLFQGNGHTIYLHTIITGGQAIGDTVSGLKALAKNFPAAPIIVWLNAYFGAIAMDGKRFEEFKVYQEYGEQFQSIITLPEGNRATIGKDLEDMLSKRQSFATAMNACQSIIVRSRLLRYWNALLSAIEAAQITA